MIVVKNPKTEYSVNPICVPVSGVRFAWEADCDRQSQRQVAYQIQVVLGKETVWDSGKVCGEDTAGIVYAGAPLLPRRQYAWRVKIFTDGGECSAFSNWQTFETTLSAQEWDSVSFIGASTEGLPSFRRQFCLPNKQIVCGRVYVCGLGGYVLWLNGKRVGQDCLNLMVTRYHQRYFYQAFDVTKELRFGENVFGVLLGNGYYSMSGNGVDWQTENWANAAWADKPKCKLVAFITYADGTQSVVSTDENWKCAESALRVEEAYYGEEWDFRRLENGWLDVGFDDSGWQNAFRVAPPAGCAEPQLAEGCSVKEVRPMKTLYQTEQEILLDAEKMLAGWVKLTVVGKRGDLVEVAYSEWLDENGRLDGKGLISAWDFKGRKRLPQTDYFILSGVGEETLAPSFQYKGFRYVRVRTTGTLKIRGVYAEKVCAGLTVTGRFACSDAGLNHLHEACVHTLENNLHSYPSDTPVYEKLGYLADGYLTQELAHYNFDAVKYYEKWAWDIIDQAKKDGYIEQTAPMWDENKENAPEWSVGIAVVPDLLYRFTGDKKLLLACYEKAKAVFGYQMRLADGYIATSMWGDHASANGKTIPKISSTCALFSMAKILAKTAQFYGKTEEKALYLDYADRIQAAFHARFYQQQRGWYGEDSDEFVLGAQVLPYAVGIVDEETKPKIAEAIRLYATAFDGGIFGVKYLFPVLTELGLQNRLMEWALAKEEPSWGYWLSFGDGTLWEQWRENGRSRNHHMFGTVDEWLFKSLAGLEVLDSKRLVCRPTFAERLQWAGAAVKLPSGEASCQWERKDGRLLYRLKVPFNVSATVCLPKEKNGGWMVDGNKVNSFFETDAERVMEVGAGEYSFVFK